jgi:hypothetical protein
VLLDRELTRRFGAEAVFRAGRSIRPSEDFVERLLAAVRHADILIAVIGPRWLTATSTSGRRLLDDEQDWVRREIAEAFRCGIPVLPVLVDDAVFPTADELPSEITKLARCQHLRLHHRNADYDIARLVTELRDLVPGLTLITPTASLGRPSRLRGILLAAAVLLSALGTYAAWQRSGAVPATTSATPTLSSTVPDATTLTAKSPLTGRAVLGPEDHLDFESGTVGNGISGLDLYFPTETSPIAANLVGAIGDTSFATASAPTKESCSQALATRGDTTLDVKTLGVGGAFCVRTTEGNIASARIADYTPANPQRLILEFTTWR